MAGASVLPLTTEDESAHAAGVAFLHHCSMCVPPDAASSIDGDHIRYRRPFLRQESIGRGWRDGLLVRRMAALPENLGKQHPHEGSRASVIPVPGVLTLSFALR